MDTHQIPLFILLLKCGYEALVFELNKTFLLKGFKIKQIHTTYNKHALQMFS